MVYRDNCKVGLPLSDAKAAGAPVDVSTIAEEAVRSIERPIRKRLPKSRPSQTTSFTVGGAEGYMTAGSYPDDGLGEVFLKLGKQGSTLAGGDGRVLDGYLDFAAVRRPSGDVRREVHQHEVQFTSHSLEVAGAAYARLVRWGLCRGRGCVHS
jgi:hypothetical protein